MLFFSSPLNIASSLPLEAKNQVLVFSSPSILTHCLFEYATIPFDVETKTVPSFVDAISLISLLGRPLSELNIIRCSCKKVPTDKELGVFPYRNNINRLKTEINRIINK